MSGYSKPAGDFPNTKTRATQVALTDDVAAVTLTGTNTTLHQIQQVKQPLATAETEHFDGLLFRFNKAVPMPCRLARYHTGIFEIFIST